MTGNDLQQRRYDLHLSQEKLAQKLGVSYGTIARWEQLKGDEIPNPLLELAFDGLRFREIESEEQKVLAD